MASWDGLNSAMPRKWAVQARFTIIQVVHGAAAAPQMARWFEPASLAAH